MNKFMFSAIQLREIYYLQFSRKYSSKSNQFHSLRASIALLQSCALNQDLSEGRKVHAGMIVNGYLGSPLSATSLINMYCKCDSIADAVSVFEATKETHNVFVYNSIISGLASHDLSSEAFEFYCKLRQIGLSPDKFTFPCVIKACSSISDLKNIHGLLLKFRLNFDVFVGSALVHSYLKFKQVNDAQKVFDGLPVKDDTVIWNSMINGYVQIGEFVKALEIFRKMMDNELFPNRFTVTGVLSALALAGELSGGMLLHSFAVKTGYGEGVPISNALIDMYGKCRRLSDANSVFEKMIDMDIYSWNSIISVHEQCGDHDGALRFLKRMIRSGFRPDSVTVTAAVPACATLASKHGQEIHCYMIVNGIGGDDGAFTGNTMMDMYAKSGSLREARLIFDAMTIKDNASWNIMIMGYGVHGLVDEALDLFSRMCGAGFDPDEVSFVGVLVACSHAGFAIRGLELFEEMQPRYGVKPNIEHYACAIDMLGRAGKLDKAFDLISKMPIEPNQVVWRAFLSACRIHGNAGLAEVATRRVLEVDPEHCGNYVLMSNILGAAGKYEEVAELRRAMARQDVKKSPGCSWIELGDGVSVFFNADRGCRDVKLVYDGLDLLTACLREHGNVDVLESC
ncbi:pentatricopeptide repeat-containing protein At3g14730 [Andrographis paniculata]|uniref:pentatricopeptide repeat-containing protein At3g14730 n=1 Tax=Andrographis paniculata TaxID=175694 RepID=UPI0021E7CAF5|nr:pentatricopeptide repeat-containing protein At3g14730 [Andrographis paniculata]